jgi:NTE family protein
VVFGSHETVATPAEAVAASCAIPGFFSPVMIGDVAYIDGGLHSPTNADLLAERGLDLDLVIVSSPMSISGRGLRVEGATPFRRWAGAVLATEALRLGRRRIPVVAFQPTAADVAMVGSNAMDPTRRAAIARHAHASALRRLAHADTRVRLAPLLR